MFIANRAGWETEMTVPMRRLEGVTYMTVASIYRARKVLVDAGILAVEERGSNRASIYTLFSFEDGADITDEFIENERPELLCKNGGYYINESNNYICASLLNVNNECYNDCEYIIKV